MNAVQEDFSSRGGPARSGRTVPAVACPNAAFYPGNPLIEEDLHLEVLRLLEQEPDMSQRQLARSLGLSVGKTHYALKAVLDRGWVKAQNFRRSDNRSAYLYKLTPNGLQEKARLAYGLLQRKRAEHAALMTEIEQLRAEVQRAKPADEPPTP